LFKLLLIQKKHGQKQLRTFYKPFFSFLFLTGLSEPGSISKITWFPYISCKLYLLSSCNSKTWRVTPTTRSNLLLDSLLRS